jgi:hypothetical protein
MRITLLWLAVVVTLPASGSLSAQADWQPTPPPQIAELAGWQVQSEPLFYAGDFYDPSGPNVFFDGNVMARIGTFQGVPLFTDTTRRPFSVVLVPIGRNLMRPYERRSSPGLVPVGTTQALAGDTSAAGPLVSTVEPIAPDATAVGTGGVISPAREADSLSDTSSTPPPAFGLTSIPPPEANSGVWIEFDNARWYSAGRAVVHSPDRFTQVGINRGVPIYQLRDGPAEIIYAPAVVEGPLAPYQKR